VIYLPLLAPTTHPTEAIQLFSKQFRKGYSPKFARGFGRWHHIPSGEVIRRGSAGDHPGEHKEDR
jgi:hypothetical protein